MKFISLLPPNSMKPEVALEEAHASRIDNIPVPIRDIRSPEKTPEAFLSWLAWDNGVTWWEDNWSDSQKRRVISLAHDINRHRGTAGALKWALAALDFPVDVIEWFQVTPKEPPYTFRLRVHAMVSADELKKIEAMTMDAKNARSFLAGIDVIPPGVDGEFFVAGATYTTVFSSIGVRDE